MATHGVPMTIHKPRAHKAISRAQLAADVESFLAAGGEIQRLPYLLRRDVDTSFYRERNQKRWQQ